MIDTFVRCSVTGLHLSNIAQHKTLRSYAATAEKAIGIYYDIDAQAGIYPVGMDYPVVLIQNQTKNCRRKIEQSAIFIL
jgi:hypothetical protein